VRDRREDDVADSLHRCIGSIRHRDARRHRHGDGGAHRPTATCGADAVVLTVSGHVTLASDGRPVPGVRVRIAPFAISGGCSTPCARAPGPDVVVTSDARGAYSATVSAWTIEALADSSSSQLSLFVTPPTGMQVVAVTQSSTFPIGPIASNDPQWYFMLARALDGPIDITLAAQ
jgi:hypothetical protein